MKIYLKSNLGWLLVEVLAIGGFSGLIWLDGYRNLPIILYAVLLIIGLSGAYALLDYYRNREFYLYLNGQEIHPERKGFLTRVWQRQFLANQKIWYQRVQELEAQHNNQVKLMNIWVHQMKTPLAVLELMAENEELAPLEVMEQTDRLKNGLNTVLSYTRLDNFTEDFVLETVSLRELLQEAINHERRSFIRREIYPKISGTDFIVITDRKWLKILLSQVISNGIKYSTAGQQLLFHLEEASKRVTIQDFGVGIPASDLPRVFRPFFTGENGRNYGEATGIGLYLVETIAKELTIELSLTSTVGVGTSIQLTFIDNTEI